MDRNLKGFKDRIEGFKRKHFFVERGMGVRETVNYFDGGDENLDSGTIL